MSYKEPKLGEYWHIPEDDERFLDPEFANELISVENVPVRSAATVEVSFDKTKKITEKQLDNYINVTGGSYDDAFRHFGVTPEQIIYEKNEEEAVEDVIPNGPSVDLGERAINLSLALDDYLKANKLQSFNNASSYNQKISERYGSKEVSRIINSEGEARIRADEAFARAFGSEALVAAGYDPEHIDRETKSESVTFINAYTGRTNENKRKKLRKRLDEYKKEATK